MIHIETLEVAALEDAREALRQELEKERVGWIRPPDYTKHMARVCVEAYLRSLGEATRQAEERARAVIKAAVEEYHEVAEARDASLMMKGLIEATVNDETDLILSRLSAAGLLASSGPASPMLDEETIERFAIIMAKGNNGGEWATHYTEDQKNFWRQAARDLFAAAPASPHDVKEDWMQKAAAEISNYAEDELVDAESLSNPRIASIIAKHAPNVKDADNALRAARSLLSIDEVVPAIHPWEIEKRNEARKRVIALIDAALNGGK